MEEFLEENERITRTLKNRDMEAERLKIRNRHLLA